MKRVRFIQTKSEFKSFGDFIENGTAQSQFAAIGLPEPGTLIEGPLVPVHGWICLERDREVDVYFEIATGGRAATLTKFYRRLDLDDLTKSLGIGDRFKLMGFECILPAYLLWQGGVTLRVRQQGEAGGHPALSLITRTEDADWPDSPDGRVFPVIVSSLGRSGSSLLQALIAAHPQAVGERSYPRECKYGQAVMTEALGIQMAGGIAETDWGAQSPANPYFANLLRLSSLMQNGTANYDFLYSELWESRRRFALEITERVYRRFFPEHAARAKFFVEKGSNVYSSVLTRYFYNIVRDVVLIRDPRDLAASAVSYNRSGAPADFAEFGSDFEAAVRTMGTQLKVLDEAQAYKADTGLLVRYEDLVSDMLGVVNRIFAHIGFPLDEEETVATITTAMAELGSTYDRHRTSGASADRSIGRWRRDLDEAQKAILETHTGWFTRKYYPEEAPGPDAAAPADPAPAAPAQAEPVATEPTTPEPAKPEPAASPVAETGAAASAEAETGAAEAAETATGEAETGEPATERPATPGSF